ncbi:hypothetical protein CLV52_2248 [Amnibacterium kyonggiense]|uniref:Uncharacterized protein n=1 Tax=Amnibacterium kyonggiense TaxID=595671 RepID=A0A4R7FLL6_9MICO|nr:hypothetical protein CLV52_2248 [Amnibacterium kyonggiense]
MILLGAIAVLAGVVGVQLAIAAPEAARPRPTPTAIDWDAVRPGADASWPSCTPPHGATRTMPLADRPAFVVVGVNDGLPGTTSACIERELAWADATTGGSSQPRLAYYVMAADPWTAPERKWVPHPFWPASNAVGGVAVAVPAAFASDAHGTTCVGGHAERACAYVYGWAMAQHAASIPGLRSPARHRFWVDVEAERTWSDDQRFNQAVVEGMVAAFTTPVDRGGVGTTTGVYSDHGEWSRIIGRLRNGSPLDGLDEWIAIGRTTKAKAVDALLHDWPLTANGRIRMVQWLDGRIDRDIALPAGAEAATP